jgi:hypothetical protein
MRNILKFLTEKCEWYILCGGCKLAIFDNHYNIRYRSIYERKNYHIDMTDGYMDIDNNVLHHYFQDTIKFNNGYTITIDEEWSFDSGIYYDPLNNRVHIKCQYNNSASTLDSSYQYAPYFAIIAQCLTTNFDFYQVV